jgi:hypothetical protein
VTKIFLLLFCFLFIAVSAQADSPTSNVGSASVTEGKLAAETRFGAASDESGARGAQRMRLRHHIDYGVTDWYAARVLLSQIETAPDNIDHRSVAIDNRFQIFDRQEDGFDGGFRFGYSHSDGNKTPHGVSHSWHLQGKLGDAWSWRHNTLFDHEVGPDSESGLNLEFRHRLTRSFEYSSTNLQLGAELFSTLGNLRNLNGYSNTEQQIGPVLLVDLEGGTYFKTAYRSGISSSSIDHTWAVFIGQEF